MLLGQRTTQDKAAQDVGHLAVNEVRGYQLLVTETIGIEIVGNSIRAACISSATVLRLRGVGKRIVDFVRHITDLDYSRHGM